MRTDLSERVGSVLPAGSHGGTYNNNPLAMAVGNAALDLLLAEGLFDHVSAMGERLVKGLKNIGSDKIKDVRGVGLMIGLEPVSDARALSGALLMRGLTTSPTVTNIIRLVPPLNVSATEIDEALEIIAQTLQLP